MSLLTETGESLLLETGEPFLEESETGNGSSASLKGRANLNLVVQGSLQGAATSMRLHSQARIALSAVGRVQGRVALYARAGLRFTAFGALTGATTPLQLGSHATLMLVGHPLLRYAQSIKAKSQITLQARSNGVVSAPKLRAQRLNDKLIASVYANPAVIRLAWALDDAPLADVGGALLNPHGGQPLILDIPGFQAPKDGVLHRVTVQAWQAAGERTSSRATSVVDLKPAAKSNLTPPKTVRATRVRDWTPNYRDLTRIEWEWGDDAPGMVEVFAYIRPVGANNKTKREFKNLSLGVVDANTLHFMEESIGIKINWSGPTRVYFGVARYLNNERSPELITNAVYITANVNEDVTETVFNPDLEAGTVKTWTQIQLTNAMSQQLGITTTTVQDILNAALLKMKEVVAKGGSVAIEDVGTFDVLWSDPIVRVDRVTGKTTTTPAQRNARFVPSPGFKLGTQRGSVLNDDDVTE